MEYYIAVTGNMGSGNFGKYASYTATEKALKEKAWYKPYSMEDWWSPLCTANGQTTKATIKGVVELNMLDPDTLPHY